ncbi:hypothetical protein IscW_ISCW007358 [Ixodes scapularis]|uniref:Uncharacterized protein n=1 Tax=Ixodes scapularis TaxID=6945 RepID=B7PWU9_IXOSC|nr:hypothetical protein IscW_ISCW007358 [Ixodes scapularis]|eukprot:XP_002410266.1 hypothetical protein IscW_ISCW007358 [Ixodes scapularis]
MDHGGASFNWTDDPAYDPDPSPDPSSSSSLASTLSSSSTPSPYRYQGGGRLLYSTSTLTPEAARSQYYAGYDPMTGLRIAATLGAIITLFTLFLIYKSKCRPSKTDKGTQPPPQEGV